MKKPRKMANCHPDRPYYAKGLCRQCYNQQHHKTRVRSKNTRREIAHRYYKKNKEEILKRKLESDPEYQIRTHLKHTFGITLEKYKEMVELQGGGCAICGKTKEENGMNLAVDHDHATGEIRGILCRKCNLMLGYIEDNVVTLQRAIDYLESGD